MLKALDSIRSTDGNGLSMIALFCIDFHFSSVQYQEQRCGILSNGSFTKWRSKRSRRMSRVACDFGVAQGKLGFVALELLSQSEHCAIESRLAISDALALSSALHPSQLGAGGRREWVTRPSRRVFCLCSSKFGERKRRRPKRKGRRGFTTRSGDATEH